jgi:hypothetical protein
MAHQVQTISNGVLRTRRSGDKRRPLSKTWTATHEAWECEGQWARLLEEYERLGSKAGLRWHAAAMRAAAFLGQLKLFKTADASFCELNSERKPGHDRDAKCETVPAHDAVTETPNDLFIESLIVRDLALARLHRSTREWARAKYHAMRASVRAARSGSPALRHDAEFALSFALAEEGRLFLALDGFQKIAASPTSPVYRKELAALNAAYLLWDTGQPFGIDSVFAQVPLVYRVRLELIRAINNLDHDSMFSALNDASLLWRLPASELEQIALLCLEWAFLFRDDSTLRTVEALQESWLDQYLYETDSSSVVSFLREAFSTCIHGQALESDGWVQFHEGDWRTQLEFDFLRMLSHLSSDPTRARALYEQNVLPTLRGRNLLSPLFPRPEATPLNPSPWAKHLSARLGLNVAVTVTSNPRLILTRSLLSAKATALAKGDLDLGKSAVSLKLLSLIQGPRGHKVSKRRLHEGLTGTRYNSHLHDDRLHKLLKRLESRILDRFGVRPWTLPGDNCLVLECAIEVVDE